jgi:hypothetical protein
VPSNLGSFAFELWCKAMLDALLCMCYPLRRHSVAPVVPDVHLRVRRGARAVEWDGLENRCRCKPTVGSNPTPSAR